MATCVRCQKTAGFLGSIDFNKKTGRCGKCESAVRRSLNSYRDLFIVISRDGIITPDEWAQLGLLQAKEQLDPHETLTFIRGDALNLLERTLTFAAADGMVTDDEARDVIRLRQALEIPDDMARPILERLSYLQNITAIRRGSLPTIRASVQLESDELCHLETAATYNKVNARSTTQIPGRLVATNKKLHFLSQVGGAEIAWKSVMRIQRMPTGVYLELSKKSGNGYYAVADPLFTEAVLDAIMRIQKRQLITPQDDQASRHIPQDIRIAVWQRDQGKCTQCTATSYLEFDHIIPFSKGGASTVNNVQLLCRKCNLTKGDRI